VSYVVDFTARIQVFDRDGKFLPAIAGTRPITAMAGPGGLSIDRDGNLIVSDSHYHCFRIYSPEGKELRKFGGEAGTEPGQLGYVSDVVQDAEGYYYVAEFGKMAGFSKFTSDGSFVKCWGSPGSGDGEFARARALALGTDACNLYVADACNQSAFKSSPATATKGPCCFGTPGNADGQLSYPLPTWLSTQRATLTW